MNNALIKNIYLLIVVCGILFLDVHLMTLNLEFSPNLQSIIPALDILILFGIYCLLKNGKKEYMYISLVFVLIPLLILFVYSYLNITRLVLSEYYFLGQLIRVLLFFALVNYSISEDVKVKRDTNFIFCFFLLLLILPNLFFIVCDYLPVTWDTARHNRNAFYIYNLIFEKQKGVLYGYMNYDLYPSIGYLLSAPFIFIFGKSNNALVLSIILFWLPLSFYYTKKIINEAFNIDEVYAIIIAFICHSNLLYLAMYKRYQLDFQPVALVAVYYYYVYRSSFFNNKKYCIVSGLIFGIGFLTKQSFLLYVAPLVLFAFVKITWNSYLNLKHKKQWFLVKWNNLFLHLFFAVVVILPWYGGWEFMYSYEMNSQPDNARLEGDPEPYTLESMFWYLRGFISIYTWPFLLLLGYGWYKLFKFNRYKIHKYIAGVSLLLIYVILVLTHNKDTRFIIGFYFFAGFGFVGLTFINEKFRHYVLLFATLICFVYSIHLVSWKKINVYGVTLTDYAFQDFPISPLTHDEAGALASFEKIFLKLPLDNDKKILNYTSYNREIYDNFSLVAQRNRLSVAPIKEYNSIINKKDVMTEIYRTDQNVISGCIDSNSVSYLYGRDPIYQSYYLFGFYKNDTSGVIRLEGFEGDLAADCRFVVRKVKGDTTIEIQEGWIAGSDKFEISVPPNIQKLIISIEIIHHKGRWQLIYLNKFTPYFNGNYLNGAFVPYSKHVDENKNWIIPIN